MAIDVKVGLDFGKIAKGLDALGKSSARAAAAPIDKAFEVALVKAKQAKRLQEESVKMQKAGLMFDKATGGFKESKTGRFVGGAAAAKRMDKAGGGLMGAAAGMAAGPAGIAAGALIGSSPILQKTLERLIKSVALIIQPLGDLLAVGFEPLIALFREIAPLMRGVFRPLTKWLRVTLKGWADALKETPLVKGGLDKNDPINLRLKEAGAALLQLDFPLVADKLYKFFQRLNELTIQLPDGGLLKKPVEDFLNGLKIWWDDLTAKLPDVGKVAQDFFSGIKNLWNSLITKLGPVGQIVTGFFDVVKSVWKSLTDAVGTVLTPIKDFFMQLWDWVQKIAEKLTFKLPKIENPFGFIGDLFGGSKSPAQLLKPGREAGREALLNPQPQFFEVKVKVEASPDFRTSLSTAASKAAQAHIQNMAQTTTMMSYSPRGY